MNETQIATRESTIQPSSAFSNESSFEAAQRMAKALCSSPLVPEIYRGQQNIGSAVIALEIAQRLGASPLMIMQNLYVIHGRPSWSSQFIIAALNSCGRFSPLRFDMTSEGDSRQCIAWAYDKTGEKLEGPAISIAIAKKEGWFQKNGSKWQTMPELMLRYRAASFFGKLYAPEILMGIQTQEEVIDIDAVPVARTPKFGAAATEVTAPEIEAIEALPEPEPEPEKPKEKLTRRAAAPDDRPPIPLETLRRNMALSGISGEQVIDYVEEQTGTRFTTLEAISKDVLGGINTNWDGCKEAILEASKAN